MQANSWLIAGLRAAPATAAELRAVAGCSQATLSRTLAGSRALVATLGRGRATRYGLRRAIPDLSPEIPVRRVDRLGHVQEVGTLVPVEPRAYWFDDQQHSQRSALHYSLPWFITDMRPQGYLGRLFPHQYPGLRLPDRIADWSEDQALYALARRGEDVVGNLVLGDESFARWQERAAPSPIDARQRMRRYVSLASQVAKGALPGSSAAGEQPKFLAVVASNARQTRHVLVKFSPATDTPIGRRWADLLLAEHLASEILREHHHAAAVTEYLGGGRHAFLEVTRFDREGARGRLGLVSLGALDDQFIGERRSWAGSAAVFLRLGLIDAAAARELRFLQVFGRLIGNTDMHLGNASFLHEGERRLRLAPAYDMLPMKYAPVGGVLPRRNAMRLEIPAEGADQWRAAVLVARSFWERLCEDGRASRTFRRLAMQELNQFAR